MTTYGKQIVANGNKSTVSSTVRTENGTGGLCIVVVDSCSSYKSHATTTLCNYSRQAAKQPTSGEKHA